MVTKEFIDSDRVNFLIWRYLLEGNYRETAAKFQKEWHVKQPHQHFSFAPHVKGHALVSVINRGLIYHSLERQQAGDELPDAEAESVQVGIFGPLVAQPPAKVEDVGVADATPATATTTTPFPPIIQQPQPQPQLQQQQQQQQQQIPSLVTSAEDPEGSRKRSQQYHQLPNGSPVKRPRLSNGYDNGTEASSGNPMDVDTADQQDNHYPSPLEGEEATTPVVTEGPQIGTQPEKVEELTPHTTFLNLTDDDFTNARSSASPGPDANPAASNAPTLLHCQWSPRDPSVLAAAGSGALARIWSISRLTASAPDSMEDHVVPSGRPLLPPNTPLTTVVSQMAWTADGGTLAVVAESDDPAQIHVYASEGSYSQSFESQAEQVIKLSWNPSGTAFLAISPSPDDNGALINVFYANFALGPTSLSYSFPGHDIHSAPLDASWTSDNEFLVCGGDMLVSLYCDHDKIVQVRKFDTRPDDTFRNVLFDWRSKLAATGSENGMLDLWDESGQRKSIQAHRGAITTMEWQPLPANQPITDNERLIATGGEDCAILIWNARQPDTKARSFLTMEIPIVRLAFTPDGVFIAGATADQVLIWKVSNPILPKASWQRKQHPGWQSPKAASESDDDSYAEHCLCWDAEGHKLAYGSNSRLAVINWNRQ